ncbi:glycosyl transferase family protein [[Clostridium] cellulosi]|uniref:Glycosyl transferase family protein n=1 Tax=[Clostridium] cellulosi TaxID=29343 RepID=A0A078KQS4_9FIRM|nr:glycosyl transferase family protein [[Clostridium] cellulosi]
MLSAIAQLSYSVKQSIVILASLFLSSIIAYLSTPLAIKFARKIDAVDVPADNRRMHSKPIPLLGGLAIIVAFLITATVMMRYHRLLWQILPGALIIALLGIIDDKHPLPAWPKLLVQCVAAALPIAVNPKIVIESISGFNIFGINTIHFGAFAIPVTILWIIGITNAVNFIDGLDGLAAGISTIASISMLIVAIIKMSVDPNEYSVAILTAALAGGCLGILPYNKNPAKVFLGDTGATFLGYTLAVISIQGLFKTYTAVSFAVPILVLGLPIIDICAAVVRRLKEHKSPFAADRCHIHHKLIDKGLDQKQAVGLLYCVSAILGISAIIFAAFDSSTGWLFLLGAVGLIAEVCILAIPNSKNANDESNIVPDTDGKAGGEIINTDNAAGRIDENNRDES